MELQERKNDNGKINENKWKCANTMASNLQYVLHCQFYIADFFNEILSLLT